MRLLKLNIGGQIGLTRDLNDDIPPYAILSHTWGPEDDEVTFDDLNNGSGVNKKGYAKIQFCGEQASKNGLEYFWVDTCCIDKTYGPELQEAITSMFRWYRHADQCYVYLSDVSADYEGEDRTEKRWKSAFRNSRWFTRGWTLQELIAPDVVEFFSREGELLGSKESLEPLIHEITQISIEALRGAPLCDFSVSTRLRWADNRATKKHEDRAYCLMGIFDVFMPLIYGEGENAFVRLKEQINKHPRTTFDEIDAAVRKHYLCDGCLTIERLSGKTLPMERCFINLAIVDHVRDGDRKESHDADAGHHSSRFSLAVRLKVETPPKTKQVTLQTLFSPRKRSDGMIARPNRILIWGRAGIGKTSLCKKMVHEFIHNALWSDLFDRIYWIPLRRLKFMSNVLINVGQLIQMEHLPDASEPQLLAEVLQKGLASHGNRTLFILDGLDEVSYAWQPDTPMGRIINQLLTQANTIVTSRPHSTYVLDHISPDLELETIGFLPAQVEEYLEKEIKQMGTSEKTVLEIRSFIRGHPLVQNLARIPVQLDAMCYAWNAKRFPKDNVTMTVLYQAITQRLWEKDIIRLEKKVGGERITRQQVQDSRYSRDLVKGEIRFLEELAFGCLYNEIIEFDTEHIGQAGTGQELIWADHPVHMSFLRSSDNSLSPADRTYHFIHLTFQEFFAAQYFVRHWASSTSITLWKMDLHSPQISKNTEQIMPVDFMRQEKYSARYDIFWRFVAGLLHNEDLRHLHRFFDIAEGEPRDLLGPTHQRFVIHCLSEIRNSPYDFQSRVRKLEENYRSWTLFEFKINSSTALLQEAECSDRVVTPWLTGSDDEKIMVMSALKDRPTISSQILKTVMSGLDKPTNEDMLSAIFQVLGCHCGQITGEKFFDLIFKQDINMRITAVVALGRSQILGISAVEALVRLLQEGDSEVQWRVANVLRRQYTLPASAAEAVVRLLQDEDHSVLRNAVDILCERTTLPASAVEALVRLLQDGNLVVRSRAVKILCWQTSLPSSAMETLVRLLQDEDQSVQSNAVDVLGARTLLPSFAVEALVRLLQDEDRYVRPSAAQCLGAHTTLPSFAVEALVRLLQDGDSKVQWRAADALGAHTTLPRFAVEALVRLLQNKDSHVRSTAVRALGEQATLPAFTVEALVWVLQDRDFFVRSNAAYALGAQTTLPASTVEALVRLLLDEDESIQSNATAALGAQTTLPNFAMEALVRLLQDENPVVRFRATRALGAHTTLPAFAAEALVRLLQDGDSDVRSSAVKLLRRQTALPSSAVEALVRLLQDENPVVRFRATEALGAHTTLPAFAAEALARLLQDGDSDVQSSAVKVLRRQTALPSSAVEVLVRVLQDGDQSMQSKAADALGAQTTLPSCAVEALVRLLQDENPVVRFRATEALGALTTLPAFAAEALVRLLQDGDSVVRWNAANALGRQITLPASAVEVLVRPLQNGDVGMRWWAVEILRGQTTLPAFAADALVPLLQDRNRDVQVRAATILRSQTSLPDSTVEKLICLQVGKISSDVAGVLENCENFYSMIPCLSSSSLQALLTFWLRRSFRTSVTCSIWNGVLSVDIDGKQRRIPLEKGKHKAFESVFSTAQKAIGSPRHFIRQIQNTNRKDTNVYEL